MRSRHHVLWLLLPLSCGGGDPAPSVSQELREVQDLRQAQAASRAEIAKLSERLTKLESELASHSVNEVDVSNLLDARERDDAQYDAFIKLLGWRARIAEDIKHLSQTAFEDGTTLGGESAPQFAELLHERFVDGVPDPARPSFPSTVPHVLETASRIEREDPTKMGPTGVGVRRVAWWRRLKAAGAATVTLFDQLGGLDLDAVQRAVERRERARRIVDDDRAELASERLRRARVSKGATGPRWK
jgi:hypothetical protein